MKSSFALVCKRWHGLAIPLLYEILHINRCEDLRPLEDMLQQSAGSTTDASTQRYDPPRGIWVCRLDVAMDDLSTTESDTINILESLTLIFMSLPKLKILPVHALPSLPQTSVCFQDHMHLGVRISEPA